jgi:hypothetical protein
MMYQNDSMYIGPGTNCPENGTPTAVEDATANSVSIYPNPTKGIATIYADQDVESVLVRSLSGSIATTSSSNEIDLSGLAPSMYLAGIWFTNGSKTVQKVIKK